MLMMPGIRSAKFLQVDEKLANALGARPDLDIVAITRFDSEHRSKCKTERGEWRVYTRTMRFIHFPLSTIRFQLC
jgi:hypothetical protein